MRRARKDNVHKPNDLCTMEQAAIMVQQALTDTVMARPGEPLSLALANMIDARIREQRWYRRLWRKVAR